MFYNVDHIADMAATTSVLVTKPVRFQNVQPLPYTIDKTLTPALMYVFDQPLTVGENLTGVSSRK
jgi:hypothetical protein